MEPKQLKLSKHGYAIYADARGYKPGIDLHSLRRRQSIVTASSTPMSVTADLGANSFNQLEFGTWLPAAAKEYHISSSVEDYVIVPVIAMPTDLPNRNGVGFPLRELKAWRVDDGMLAFQTFRGKPVHVEHDNCFPGNTPVKTTKGFQRIDALQPGTLVYTGTGDIKPVVQLFSNGVKTVDEVWVEGLGGKFEATSGHNMLVVDRRQVYNKLSHNHRRPELDVVPHFRQLSDVYPGDYFVTPITMGGDTEMNPAFAFLTGVYAAEGSINGKNPGTTKWQKSTVFTLGYAENELVEKIVDCLETLELKYTVTKKPERSVTLVHIWDVDFATQMQELVGEYSHKKAFSKSSIKDWDTESLLQLMGGYISGDGCTTTGKGSRLRIVTVSKHLAFDTQNILARLGIAAPVQRFKSKKVLVNAVYGEYERKPTFTIGASACCGEILNDYIVGKEPLLMDNAKPGRLLVTDEYLLLPVFQIKRNVRKTKVYDIEVEGEHSYTANNIAVHNSDPTKAVGVIVDTAMVPMIGYGGGTIWKLLLLLAIDRSKDPVYATQVLSGDINSYSMGAWVEAYSCGYCGAPAGACRHIDLKRPRDFYILDGKLVYRRVHRVKGFECSIVKDPAFVTAISDRLLSL